MGFLKLIKLNPTKYSYPAIKYPDIISAQLDGILQSTSLNNKYSWDALLIPTSKAFFLVERLLLPWLDEKYLNLLSILIVESIITLVWSVDSSSTKINSKGPI